MSSGHILIKRSFLERFKLIESWHIPGISGFWYSFMSSLDNKIILQERIPENPLNKIKRNEIVIASLTSYPARINFVWIAIKSIMLQTYKPDRIILWLAEEQFPKKDLPETLIGLQNYGLEIKWTKDFYGHKKYCIPVMEQKQNEVVITFDDDIIYSPLCIERLINTHKRFPNCLICERGQAFEDKEQLNPGRWVTISNIGVDKPTYSLNPSPGGGCLIPFGAFHPDAVKKECFCSLAYKNDDLWFMFMCAANGTRMIKTRKYHRIFSVVNGSQIEQMAIENVTGERNKVIMERLIKSYPDAWRRIFTDKD